MNEKWMNGKEKACLIVGEGVSFDENLHYACYACNTTGPLVEKPVFYPLFNSKAIFINSKRMEVLIDDGACCPNCGNSYVLTNATKQKAGFRIEKIDIRDTTELFLIDLELSEHHLYVTDNKEAINTYLKTLNIKSLPFYGFSFPKGYFGQSYSNVVSYLVRSHDFSKTIRIGKSLEKEMSKKVTWALAFDKKSKALTMFTREPYEITYIESSTVSRGMEAIELTTLKSEQSLKKFEKIYSILPAEVQKQFVAFLMKCVSPYIQTKFGNEHILNAMEIIRLATINRFPAYEQFSLDFNPIALNIDAKTMEDLSCSNTDQLLMSLVPNASKKVRSRMKKLTLPANKMMSDAISLKLFSMLTKPETMNNLLDYMEKHNRFLSIEANQSFENKKMSMHHELSALLLAEKLYGKLQLGALDQYMNDVLTGKAFMNEGKEGQKRAVRNIEVLISTNLNTIQMLAEDTCKQLFLLESYEAYFLDKLNMNNEVSVEDRVLYEEQLKKVQQFTQDAKVFGSIKKLHKEVSTIINDVMLENVSYDFDESELNYEQNILGFDFKMPKETLEIMQLGKELDICVGSYDQEVIDRECYVVGVYNNDKAVLCIELDTDYAITQVKKFDNVLLDSSKLFDAEIIEALEVYIETVGLSVHTEDLCMTQLAPESDLDDEYWESEAV